MENRESKNKNKEVKRTVSEWKKESSTEVTPEKKSSVNFFSCTGKYLSFV